MDKTFANNIITFVFKSQSQYTYSTTQKLPKAQIAIFQGKEIRRKFFNHEWWFSIIDIVEVLAGTDRPRKYWNDLKTKLIKEGYTEVSEKIGQLKLEAPDGKLRETDCASTETTFRIIQSIPSPTPNKISSQKIRFNPLFEYFFPARSYSLMR